MTSMANQSRAASRTRSVDWVRPGATRSMTIAALLGKVRSFSEGLQGRERGAFQHAITNADPWRNAPLNSGNRQSKLVAEVEWRWQVLNNIAANAGTAFGQNLLLSDQKSPPVISRRPDRASTLRQSWHNARGDAASFHADVIAASS